MAKPAWRLFERWLAKLFNGKTSWGSGVLWHQRMDVRGEWPAAWPAMMPYDSKEVVISAKYTTTGVRVTRRDVDQLIHVAAAEGREPVLAIAFGEVVMIGFFMPWEKS